MNERHWSMQHEYADSEKNLPKWTQRLIAELRNELAGYEKEFGPQMQELRAQRSSLTAGFVPVGFKPDWI